MTKSLHFHYLIPVISKTWQETWQDFYQQIKERALYFKRRKYYVKFVEILKNEYTKSNYGKS